MPEYWDAYLEEIGEQVRWKSIRELLEGFYHWLIYEGILLKPKGGKNEIRNTEV